MSFHLSRSIASRIKLGTPRLCRLPTVAVVDSPPLPVQRLYHSSPLLQGTRSQILKDVGEGISEVQIIQWYVEEGARIEEWSPLCQYQSDKAVDDITSRYEGVIKRLHVQADDTVETGKKTDQPLCDIEVEEQQYPDDAPKAQQAVEVKVEEKIQTIRSPAAEDQTDDSEERGESRPSRHRLLATPAVRALLKTSGVEITEVQGTGKDGRVLKEDVQRFIAAREFPKEDTTTFETLGASEKPTCSPVTATADTPQTETRTSLTPIQKQMFQKMSESRAVVPFLFSDEMDSRFLTRTRNTLLTNPANPVKLSVLPFIVKAVSTALHAYPILNARIDATTDPAKPCLIHRNGHNIGIAVDTPTGLIVPNIKNVQDRSILEIADEISRLSSLARSSKLAPKDLAGGTFTISNIGAIGGVCVAPVIVPTEVAILGVGRTRVAPVFNETGDVIK
ncbi:hypothetical protein KEM56_004247, partial [Ascosphaera pollenicola]